MNEEVELYLEDGTSKMDKVVAYIKDELSKMRAGKASVQMVDGLTVDYYGSQVPFSQVANLGTTDSRTLVIHPWDKKMIEKIEKVIFAANI
ncbi:MAG: ribosome recycling factor, partial [Bacteroidales bacterium]|nr:ribosome recycling factor [Bacteroidales bacterium]